MDFPHTLCPASLTVNILPAHSPTPRPVRGGNTYRESVSRPSSVCSGGLTNIHILRLGTLSCRKCCFVKRGELEWFSRRFCFVFNLVIEHDRQRKLHVCNVHNLSLMVGTPCETPQSVPRTYSLPPKVSSCALYYYYLCVRDKNT